MGRLSEATSKSGTHLTTSRINRVLRPLRTKCDKLASTNPAGSSSAVKVTYSSRTRSNSTANTNADDTPPLTILQPPESFRSKFHLDANSRNNIELSRTLYAVRDAFKNVVQVAFGGDRRGSMPPLPPTKVLSLSALCCVVVGQELGSERDTTKQEDGEEDEDEDVKGEDEEGSAWVDELYEAVPFHFRKWAVVTHALAVVLKTCPHHPTLLSTLLGVCLQQHPLIPHCELLLRALLTVAFTSPSNPNAVSPLPPPICHSAHAAYLTELKNRWCEAAFTSDRSFINIVLQILPQTSSEAWNSKAIAKLAREVSTIDFTCTIRMSTGLAEAIMASKTAKSKLEKRPNGRKLDLLVKWCHSTLEHLLSTSHVDEDEDVCLSVLDLIHTYFNGREPSNPPSPDLEDLMICIATWCLAALPSAFSDYDLNSITTHLLSSFPSKTAYSPLISRAFASPIEDEVPIDAINQIRSFSRTLRLHDLPHLEIAFIKQATTYFEETCRETMGHEPEFEEIMRDLARDLVEAGVADASSDDLDSFAPPIVDLKRKRDMEDFKTPVQKRQRRTVGHEDTRPRKPRHFEPHDEWEETPISRYRPAYSDSDQTPELEKTSDGYEEDGRGMQLGVTMTPSQMLSSDDVMDLFTLPTTSPVFVRKRGR